MFPLCIVSFSGARYNALLLIFFTAFTMIWTHFSFAVIPLSMLGVNLHFLSVCDFGASYLTLP